MVKIAEVKNEERLSAHDGIENRVVAPRVGAAAERDPVRARTRQRRAKAPGHAPDLVDVHRPRRELGQREARNARGPHRIRAEPDGARGRFSRVPGQDGLGDPHHPRVYEVLRPRLEAPSV